MKTSWGWCSTLAKYCRTGVCLFFSSLGLLETGHGPMILALNLCWFLSLEVKLRYCAATVTLLNNNWFFFLLLCLGAEDFTPEQDVEEVRQIEKQIKRRFAIGTQVNTTYVQPAWKLVIVTGWSIVVNLKTGHKPQLIRMQCTKTS